MRVDKKWEGYGMLGNDFLTPRRREQKGAGIAAGSDHA